MTFKLTRRNDAFMNELLGERHMADEPQAVDAVEPQPMTEEQRAYYSQFVIPYGQLKNIKAIHCNAELLAEKGYKSTDFDSYPGCKEALGGELTKLAELNAAAKVTEEGDANDDAEIPSTDGAPIKRAKAKKK